MNFDKTRIENICFEGGGIGGVAFVGVYHALEQLTISNIKRIIGSSAGAIFAAVAACKISYADMKSVIESTDFTKFKDAHFSILGEGYNILKHCGVYKGDYFHQWIGNVLYQFVGNKDITFEEVFYKFGIELVITTTDLTKGQPVYLNHKNNPNKPIRDAIRMSMSIPIFYIPVIEKDDDGTNHVYVDGGCMNNFPLGYFDNLYSSDDLFSRTLGFNLTDYIGDPTVEPDVTNTVANIIDVATVLINSGMNEIKALQLNEADRYRIVNIPTFGIASTNFELGKIDLARLEESGFNATIEFFK